MRKQLTSLGLPLLMLAGCSSVTPQDYADQRPSLDMTRYLIGHTTAWGLAQSRSGKVVKRFRIEMDGTRVSDGSVQVVEHDLYSDGRAEDHAWVFRDTGTHGVTATSDQVVGQADGEQYGNTLNLRYTLKVQMPDGKQAEFAVSDWFYLQEGCLLVNHTYGSKFGFHAFDVMTFFEKNDCG